MEGGAVSESARGRLEALWTKRSHRGVMDARTEATFVAGKGMEGNSCRSSTRQVTIIVREQWEAMMRELGVSVDPSARRANLMVSGVDLEASRGRTLRIGGVRIRIRGETRPCERMDEACEGLRAAMDGQWRGGAFGEVVDDGIVTLGDSVAWEAPAED